MTAINMQHYSLLLLIVVCLVFWSCDRTSVVRPGLEIDRPVTHEEWRALETKRIFFGHQSVGANILQGVSELAAENPEAKLNLVHSANPESVNGPALIDARLGRNGDPASKLDAFSAVLSRGMGSQGGIVLLKFCFTDIDKSTDVDALFGEYRKHIAGIKATYPRLEFVHVTLPLTVAEPTLKSVVKILLRRTTERELNAKRNHFNELLRRQYSGIDPIFDLAGVESTLPDGTRSFIGTTSAPVYTLAPDYTDDGSHLNRAGRRQAATTFVKVLAAAGDLVSAAKPLQ